MNWSSQDRTWLLKCIRLYRCRYAKYFDKQWLIILIVTMYAVAANGNDNLPTIMLFQTCIIFFHFSCSLEYCIYCFLPLVLVTYIETFRFSNLICLFFPQCFKGVICFSRFGPCYLGSALNPPICWHHLRALLGLWVWPWMIVLTSVCASARPCGLLSTRAVKQVSWVVKTKPTQNPIFEKMKSEIYIFSDDCSSRFMIVF